MATPEEREKHRKKRYINRLVKDLRSKKYRQRVKARKRLEDEKPNWKEILEED